MCIAVIATIFAILVLAGLVTIIVLLVNNFEIQKGRFNKIMGALQNLRAAVDTVGTNASDGFEAIQAALTELSTDIAGIPGSQDVQAEADRLSSVAAIIATATADIAQAVRDAVPTPTTEPEPGPANPPTDPVDPAAPTDEA